MNARKFSLTRKKNDWHESFSLKYGFELNLHVHNFRETRKVHVYVYKSIIKVQSFSTAIAISTTKNRGIATEAGGRISKDFAYRSRRAFSPDTLVTRSESDLFFHLTFNQRHRGIDLTRKYDILICIWLRNNF